MTNYACVHLLVVLGWQTCSSSCMEPLDLSDQLSYLRVNIQSHLAYMLLHCQPHMLPANPALISWQQFSFLEFW